MSIYEVRSDPKGKCVSCEFYKSKNGYWLNGKCSNPNSKVKRKQRYHNDKACVQCKYVRIG